MLGITADAVVNAQELVRLVGWLGEYQEFAAHHPFCEVIGTLNAAIADAIISEEELANLLWLCTRYSDDNEYYRAMTKDLQRLQGIMVGMAADGEINKAELDALQNWMGDNEHLKSCWPYAELEAVLVHVLKDGIVTVEEHGALLAFFNEFSVSAGHRALSGVASTDSPFIGGVCAVDPQVEFPGKVFCFTGSSKRCPRSELQRIIVDRGGTFSNTVVKATDYLIVGADGNPCWAFACYGRKVQQAVEMRKAGHGVLIVHEVDFWDHLN